MQIEWMQEQIKNLFTINQGIEMGTAGAIETPIFASNWFALTVAEAAAEAGISNITHHGMNQNMNTSTNTESKLSSTYNCNIL